jgi:hypothetical protein
VATPLSFEPACVVPPLSPNVFGKTIGRVNLDGTGVNQSFITGAAQLFGLAVGAG